MGQGSVLANPHGAVDWVSPAAAEGKVRCDWLDSTATLIPFRICTAPDAFDSQISRVVREAGLWDEARTNLFELFLPLEPAHVGRRTVVIDVGANIGFFSLLAVARGYDAFAVEPTIELAQRIALSGGQGSDLRAETAATKGYKGGRVAVAGDWQAIQAAAAHRAAEADLYLGLDGEAEIGPSPQPTPGSVEASTLVLPPLGFDPSPEGERVRVPVPGAPKLHQQPPARDAVLAVMRVAAGDAAGTAAVAITKGNPGANHMVPPDTAGDVEPTKVVPMDLLLSGRRPGTLPAINPLDVRIVKISAEMTDSRVLSGMRHLIGVGRPPYIMMVFNKGHVQEHGCKAEELVRTLLRAGYQIYDSGIYRDSWAAAKQLLDRIQGSPQVIFVESRAKF